MKTFLITIATLFCAFVCIAQSTERDRDFIVGSSQDGLLEIKLGELAQTRGLSPEVRDLGKMMVEQHTQTNAALAALAARKNVTVMNILDIKHQERFDKMAKEQGSAFDRMYARCAVKNHKKAVCNYKKEARMADDSDVKAWAAAQIPEMEQHLHMSRKTCDATK